MSRSRPTLVLPPVSWRNNWFYQRRAAGAAQTRLHRRRLGLTAVAAHMSARHGPGARAHADADAERRASIDGAVSGNTCYHSASRRACVSTPSAEANTVPSVNHTCPPPEADISALGHYLLYQLTTKLLRRNVGPPTNFGFTRDNVLLSASLYHGGTINHNYVSETVLDVD